AAMVGYAEFDNTWQTKILVQNTTAGAASFTWTPANPDPPTADQLFWNFENVAKPYKQTYTSSQGAEAGKYVIPSSVPLYVIHWEAAQDREALQTNQLKPAIADSLLGSARTNIANSARAIIETMTYRFLQALG